MATGDLERPCASWVSKEKGAGPAWSALEHRHKASRKREPTPTRLCAVSTRDRCRHTVPWKVAWFLWAAHALAACCNRYVRHAIPWLCWLKTTSRNLPFTRDTVELTPGAATGMAVDPMIPKPQPITIVKPLCGPKCREVSTSRGRRWGEGMGAGGTGGAWGGTVSRSHRAQRGFS
jgi:hypothetical protein